MSSPRRRFLSSLLAAPLAPAALVGPQTAPAPPGPTPSPEAADPAAEAFTEAIERRYGAHLDAADLEEIRKNVASNLKAADRIRKHRRLGNADEPVTVFEARPRGSGERRGR